MSADSRKREISASQHSFQDSLVECAQRYARFDDAPDFYSFDDSIHGWKMLHDCGLSPEDALSRMFGTLH